VRRYKGVAYFDLKVGFSCNNNCRHCVVADKRTAGDLETDVIFDVIDKNVDSSNWVVITGGEPTLRRDFFKVLGYVKSKGAKISLQTNGRMFQYEAFTQQVVEYVDAFLIAIHSHSASIHDMITERQDSWRQTVKGAHNLQKFKRKASSIASQTVLSKLNVNNLLKTFDFIYDELGICSMNMTFPHPNGNAWTYFDTIVPKLSMIKSEIQRCFAKYLSKLSVEAIPLCYVFPYHGEVRYLDGDRKKGQTLRGYDNSLDKKIIQDYDALILADYRKAESCKSCIFDANCVGVWKEYYNRYLDELDLSPIIIPDAWLINPLS